MSLKKNLYFISPFLKSFFFKYKKMFNLLQQNPVLIHPFKKPENKYYLCQTEPSYCDTP